MSPRTIKIAIAESCGWEIVESPALLGIDPKDGLQDFLPDYLGDLNAIHAVLESQMARLTDCDCTFYVHLERICFRERGLHESSASGSRKLGFSGWIAHASAAALCEAYLRTLDLWIE